MFKVLKKEKIADNIYLLEIAAADIAKHAKPGQFIMIRKDENSERIPLTIADSNKRSITLIFLVIGKTTSDLSKLKKNKTILDVAGPLGKPSKIPEKKLLCFIGGGVGNAAIYPIAKACHEKGNRVHCILGIKSKKFLFWKDKFEKISDKLLITSDDGTIGKKGNVVDGLKELNKKHKYELVTAIGPTIMMAAVAKYTHQRLRTVVSLNTLMIDGVGMCGGCRIKYDNKIKFVCVDGPEFNADKVDFNEILNRNRFYNEEEKHICRLNKIKIKRK